MDAGPSRLGRALPYLTALLIALLVCPSLLVGQPPHTADHNFHLANAVETERLLRDGRVVGWTDFQLAGHLANGFYPPLASVLIATFHWLGRGFLNWDAAYSVAFLAFLVTFALALFALARPIVGTWPALATVAVALLLDRGGRFNGGWNLYVGVGVWPFGFSVAWMLAALALFPRTLTEPGIGRICAVAVFAALAILTHPFALVLLPALALLQVAVWGAMRRVQLRGLWRALTAGALGLALAAWWWIPFVLRRAQLQDYPVPPPSAGQLLRMLTIDGRIDLISWWVVPWAVVGTWLAWKRREPWARWCILASWILVLGSCEAPYRALHIDVKHGWLANLQLVRLQAVGRLLLMALAVQALFLAASYLRQRARRLNRFLLLGAGAVAAGCIAMAIHAMPGKLRVPHGGAPRRPTCYSKSEELELGELLHAHKQRLGGHRLALYNSDPDWHCLVLAASLIEVPFFKIGHTPANQFSGKFSTQDPVELAHLDVAAVLSDEALSGPFSSLPLLERRGRFELRSLEPLPRADASDPRARVAVTHWSDEDVRLQLDTPGETELQLWVDFSPDWRAFQDGRPLPTQVASAGEARFIRLRASTGELRLHFSPPSSRFFQGISLLALASMLGVLAGEPTWQRLLGRVVHAFRRINC